MELDIKLINDVLSLCEGCLVFLIILFGILIMYCICKFVDYLGELMNKNRENLKKEIIQDYEKERKKDNSN